MTNAEKYKEEIKDVGYDFALIKNKIVACDKWSKCTDCKFIACGGCSVPRIAWLLEDYNPILTDEEKRILQNIIDALRPLGKKVKTISKRDFSPSLDEYLHFTYDGDSATTTTFDGNKMFVGMKIQKRIYIRGVRFALNIEFYANGLKTTRKATLQSQKKK